MNFGETLFNPQQLFTDLNLVYMMTNVSILITYLKVLFIQISHFACTHLCVCVFSLTQYYHVGICIYNNTQDAEQFYYHKNST